MVKSDAPKSGSGADTAMDLFEEAPIGYLLLDADALVVRVNRRGADIFGRPAARLVGRPLSDFSPDTPLERVRALPKGVQWPSGDPLQRDELQIRLPGGGASLG